MEASQPTITDGTWCTNCASEGYISHTPCSIPECDHEEPCSICKGTGVDTSPPPTYFNPANPTTIEVINARLVYGFVVLEQDVMKVMTQQDKIAAIGCRLEYHGQYGETPTVIVATGIGWGVNPKNGPTSATELANATTQWPIMERTLKTTIRALGLTPSVCRWLLITNVT